MSDCKSFFVGLTIEQWLMSIVIDSFIGLGSSCSLTTHVETVEKIKLQKDNLLRYASPELISVDI